MEAFARPIPTLVICELLGAPYERRDEFSKHTALVFGTDVPPDERFAATQHVLGFIAEQVEAKRKDPGDDLLSDLIRHDVLTGEELTNIGMALLVAGLETTGNMIALGTFALLEHPDQLALLRADPALTANAVEELMRYLSVIHLGPIRTALEDIEIGGVTIKAGESITLSLSVANRDPEKFPDPEVLDLTRKATGQIGFGHGVHQCLGQQLARVELRIALPGLCTRFPDLQLAVPASEIELPEGASIYGPVRLPVTLNQTGTPRQTA